VSEIQRSQAKYGASSFEAQIDGPRRSDKGSRWTSPVQEKASVEKGRNENIRG